MDSESSANQIYDTLMEDKVINLKTLLKYIQDEYDNPSYDYVLRQCKNVKHFEDFLRDNSHLFIVENDKVAKYSEKLENGQETADSYFQEKLKEYAHGVSVESFRKHVGEAPEDIKHFIQLFYPGNEFKRYLQRRPHIFFVSNGATVCLIEKECAEFFRKIVKQGEGIHFTSLRGNVGQAPEHIRKYINLKYPGTEFQNFLENNCTVFRMNSAGKVFIVTK